MLIFLPFYNTVLPDLSTVGQRKQKCRERSTKWYHNMTDEQKAERNAKKRATRAYSRPDATPIFAGNEGF